MRRYKTVARVFLVLSVVDFAFSGPLHTRATHEVCTDLVTVAADVVTEASDKPSSTAAGQLHLRWDPPVGQTTSGIPPPIPGQLPQPAQPFYPAQPPLPVQPAKPPPAPSSKDPEADKFFNPEMMRKVKEYLVLAMVAGSFTGLANAVQKQIMGSVSPGAQTVGRSLDALDDQDHEDPVSRSLANLGDGDLQILSAVSRRVLNSLD